MAGANPLIAVDIEEWKLAKALQLGAAGTVLASRDDKGLAEAARKVKTLTGGRGADFAFECTAVPELGVAPLAADIRDRIHGRRLAGLAHRRGVSARALQHGMEAGLSSNAEDPLIAMLQQMTGHLSRRVVVVRYNPGMSTLFSGWSKETTGMERFASRSFSGPLDDCDGAIRIPSTRRQRLSMFSISSAGSFPVTQTTTRHPKVRAIFCITSAQLAKNGSAILGTISPMVLLRSPFRTRAARFETKPSSSIALVTAANVLALTRSPPLITLETVVFPTRARAATSAKVGCRHPEIAGKIDSRE